MNDLSKLIKLIINDLLAAKNKLKKMSPFFKNVFAILIGLVSFFLIVILGLSLVNNGTFLEICRDIPTRICIVLSRILTFEFGELPYADRPYNAFRWYMDFGICKTYYETINYLSEFINGIARLGVLLFAFNGGVAGVNLTKNFFNKKS